MKCYLKDKKSSGEEGAFLLVAGDASHPEVQGIVGHTAGEVQVFADAGFEAVTVI